MAMDERPGGLPASGERRYVPIPNPTLLTTEQLMREINRIQAIIDLQIKAVDERLTAEIKLTGARFTETSAARESLAGMIAGRYQAMDDNLTALKELLYARLDETDRTFQDLRLIRDEMFERLTESTALKISDVSTTSDEKFIALRDLMDERAAATDKAMVAAFAAQKEAVEKANVATEKRFDAMNESVAQLNAALVTLIPRAESEARMTALADQITDIKTATDKGFTGTDTRAAVGNQYWGYFVGAAGLLATVTLAIVALMHVH